MKSKKYIYTYIDVFLAFACAYTVATLLDRKISSIPLTRVLGMCISVSFVLIIIKKITKTEFYILAATIISICVSFAVTKNLSINFKDSLWFLNTILCIALGTNSSFKKRLMLSVKKRRKLIFNTILLSDIILLCAIITPSSYGNAWNWGNSDGFFIGFSQNGHTLCSCCCLLLVLIMLAFQNQKMRIREYILYIPPIYGIFFSGARTFLIPAAVLLLSGIFVKVKNKKKRLVITLLLALIFVVLLKNSSMMDKFNFTANNKYATSVLSSITNGRSDFWKYDLNAFGNYNIFYMLFGKGFDYIYTLNQTGYGLYIYAHNDLINFLVCLGIFGTAIYIFNWLRFTFRTQKETCNGVKLEISTRILFAVYVWIPMLLNGMFSYQHYVFSCVFLSVYYYGFDDKK